MWSYYVYSFFIVVTCALNLYTMLPLIFEEKLGELWSLSGEEVLSLQHREQLPHGVEGSAMAVCQKARCWVFLACGGARVDRSFSDPVENIGPSSVFPVFVSFSPHRNLVNQQSCAIVPVWLRR